jgi:putative transcriptional regulator
MPIIVKIDVALAERKRKGKEVARELGITEQNFSLLKSGKVKGVRFDTLTRLCAALQCQPGDLLVYVPDSEQDSAA